MKRKNWVLLVGPLICFLLTGASKAQKEVEFFGKLDAELVPIRSSFSVAMFNTVTEEERTKLLSWIPVDDKIFVSRLFWHPQIKLATRILLVEPVKGDAYLYVDNNMNTKLEQTERFSFTPSKDDPDIEGDALINFPLNGGFYKQYPVLVRRFKSGKGPEPPDGKRYLLYSGSYAQGVVDIQGRKIPVRYYLDPETGKIDWTSGLIGIDCDGDGKLEDSEVSPELTVARNEEVIFRVGDQYVSTKSIDSETGKIILRTHPASEYNRIELRKGAEVPDFTFTDFNGKARKLSDFHGKYILLDFWATWCGPCVGEIPHLKEAYTKYQPRGFEILGMNYDNDLDKIRSFVAENGITWTQATKQSTEEITNKRFRIYSWPTTVLINPEGKIITVGGEMELPLRGKELLDTLEKIMPTKH